MECSGSDRVGRTVSTRLLAPLRQRSTKMMLCVPSRFAAIESVSFPLLENCSLLEIFFCRSSASNDALSKMQSLGAIVIDNLELPSFEEFLQSDAMDIVLRCDFKEDLATYLAERRESTMRSLQDVIE